MDATNVECTCISKKETQNYNKENPINTLIELQVPYDPKSIFYQMSGGTSVQLNTVNKAVADMFALGGKYELVIRPKVEAVQG